MPAVWRAGKCNSVDERRPTTVTCSYGLWKFISTIVPLFFCFLFVFVGCMLHVLCMSLSTLHFLVSLSSRYKLVITHALGMNGIHCPRASFGVIHPSRPCYYYYKYTLYTLYVHCKCSLTPFTLVQNTGLA